MSNVRVSKDRLAVMEAVVPCGDCFRFANNLSREMIEDGTVPEDDIHVVHADVQDPPPSGNMKRYPHAWVEAQGRAYDWQMRTAGTGSLPIEDFYELRRPSDVKKYPVYEAMAMMVQHSHHGPWEDLNEDEQDPEYGLIGNVWIDDRVPGVAAQVIRNNADAMASRCNQMHSYDASVQWMDILLANEFDVQMYKGNGDHYYLVVGGGIMDPRADQIAGFPDISSNSYEAEKVVWNGNARVDQDVLQEISVESEDLLTKITRRRR